MRKILVVVVIVGLGVLYARQRHADHLAVEQVQNQPATTIAGTSPAPAKMWPKRSIDRAHEVAEQVQRQRKANDNP